MEDNTTKEQQNHGPIESDILPKAEEKRRPVFNPMGRVENIMDHEVKVADVRRHPIGLFFIYLQTIVGLSASFLLIFVLMPTFISSLSLDSGRVNGLLLVFAMFAVILGIIFLILASKIYRGNQIIITDANVTQILQVGLFNRKVSELSMHNVEDVTASQHGILQTFFNYGTLIIETAGEQNNFRFIYCPNPNAYAKAILDARQLYFERNGDR